MTRAKTIMRNIEETTQHENKVAVFASRPLNCWACRKNYDAPDFFLLLVDDIGNACLYADLDPYEPAANEEIIEVDRCPHCWAEL